MEALVYADPTAYEPQAEPFTPLWEYLQEELAEVLTDEAGCHICTEIVVRQAWADFPGWQCELADCLHCAECDLCSRSGLVCSVCERCASHQDNSTEYPAECSRGAVWSRIRKREVWAYQHRYLDAATGRWSR